MSVEELQIQIAQLTPEEWQELLGWVTGTERARRDAQPAVEEAQARLVEELWEARPDLKPETGTTEITPAETVEALVAQVKQWRQPATPLDGYPRSELAALGGRVWRNRRPGNMKKPGEAFSGWEDVTDDYLRLADAVDGNTPGVGTDAPGLITEPKPEPAPTPKPEQPKQTEPTVTPAPGVKQWKTDEWYSKGETVLDGGALYVSQKLHKATDRNRPTAGTGDWQRLD